MAGAQTDDKIDVDLRLIGEGGEEVAFRDVEYETGVSPNSWFRNCGLTH